MRRYRIYFILFGLLLLTSIRTYATHIRAGEIIAELLDCQSNTYRFTLVGYTDTGSTVEYGGGQMNFGDGSPPINFSVGNPDYFQDLGDEVALVIFYAQHTFPGPGTYIVSYREFNRNASVANMDNSVNTPFYVETQIVVDPFFGCNNTPVLLNPPLDRACVGKAFYHNPGGWDFDGDSLSYEIVVNKQDVDMPVVNYKLPNVYDISSVPGVTNEEGTGPPTYTLDPVTGDLVWDAPGQEDEYNIAFIVKEWRYFPELKEWIQMGYVTRDMQIIVQDCDNERPELTIPEDTCIEAGTLLREVIRADDPDNDRMIISSFGGPYELTSSPATYSPLPEDPINPQPNPAFIDFTWQTNCSHVRSLAYQITFKAKDYPDRLEGPSLVDFATWEVTVVGPAPEGLAATGLTNRRISLSWDQYACEPYAGNMQIWRRVDSYDFDPENCEVGMPDYAGYTLIDIVPIDQVDYMDTNNGAGLNYGATYCYRIVAEYRLPAGGLSYASEEVCITIEEDEERFGPVITKVSILETDLENGEIDLQWTSPFDADQVAFPPPYTYDIFRYEGPNGGGTPVGPISVTDTMYTDTGLDTDLSSYSYRIVAYDNGGNVVDTSALASSVRLFADPRVNSIELTWAANVPWSNNTQDYPYHYVYRDNINPSDEDELILIDSIDVNFNGFHYVDSGQVNGIKLDENTFYCYYVTTQGSYGNDQIIEPLINDSQIICNQPNDTIPPCVIIDIGDTLVSDTTCLEFIKDKPCSFDNYFHEIEWTVDPIGDDNDCIRDIVYYEVWFSENCFEEEYEIVGITSDNYFKHEGLTSFKGCYKVRAVDRSGNPGEFSNVKQFDNCPYYELPNVFTPNNDGRNDVFQPYTFPFIKCPRFVISLSFKVVNRWGKEVYSETSGGENSILINWDGTTNEGVLLESGVYYYKVDIQFDMNNPDLRSQTIKGWVQILR
jgi:gliding motility-associated-like protein